MKYKLTDGFIAQVAKLLQLSILTGTDIADHMRQLVLSADGDKLSCDADYLATFEAQLKELVKLAGKMHKTDLSLS